jgi:hypothetical protein
MIQYSHNNAQLKLVRWENQFLKSTNKNSHKMLHPQTPFTTMLNSINPNTADQWKRLSEKTEDSKYSDLQF